MPDPVSFDSSSPRFAFPLLFAGQSQKEVFVNEALSRADALLHCAIEATASTPPATPVDGQAWLIGSSPTGEWAGQSGMLACRQGGNWIYVTPRAGMQVLDLQAGQYRRYDGVWKAATSPSPPSGGTTIDTEARQALSSVINALRVAGIFPQS